MKDKNYILAIFVLCLVFLLVFDFTFTMVKHMVLHSILPTNFLCLPTTWIISIFSVVLVTILAVVEKVLRQRKFK